MASHANAPWYDIEMRGKRLEKICALSYTMYEQKMDKHQYKQAEVYLDRLLKTEKAMLPYVEEMTGLNRFLKKHGEKQALIQK